MVNQNILHRSSDTDCVIHSSDVVPLPSLPSLRSSPSLPSSSSHREHKVKDAAYYQARRKAKARREGQQVDKEPKVRDAAYYEAKEARREARRKREREEGKEHKVKDAAYYEAKEARKEARRKARREREREEGKEHKVRDAAYYEAKEARRKARREREDKLNDVSIEISIDVADYVYEVEESTPRFRNITNNPPPAPAIAPAPAPAVAINPPPAVQQPIPTDHRVFVEREEAEEIREADEAAHKHSPQQRLVLLVRIFIGVGYVVPPFLLVAIVMIFHMIRRGYFPSAKYSDKVGVIILSILEIISELVIYVAILGMCDYSFDVDYLAGLSFMMIMLGAFFGRAFFGVMWLALTLDLLKKTTDRAI